MNTNTNTSSIKCVLCNGLCENEYGNNPRPLSKTGVCCNVCNIKVVDARILFSCYNKCELEYSDADSDDEDDYQCICLCESEHESKCMGCECDECYDVCIAKRPCDRKGCTVIGWLVSPNTRLCNPHSREYAKQLSREVEEELCKSCDADCDLTEEGICINCRDEFEAEEEERQFIRNKHAQGLIQNKLGQWVPKQDIYECNTCQEDFDRANPIWIAMGIKDSNYCLPCELAHEQPIECERCKGMFAPDDMCDDRCGPCYQNYVEWLEENDMDA